jgi:hypothetical protein
MMIAKRRDQEPESAETEQTTEETAETESAETEQPAAELTPNEKVRQVTGQPQPATVPQELSPNQKIAMAPGQASPGPAGDETETGSTEQPSEVQ